MVNPHDFIWAAGFYEGEGTLASYSLQTSITQKNRWPLERMKALFGGSISPPYRGCCRWQISGARARGFLMSIYELLSPRRQEQIVNAMRRREW
jgi:hypothetical protein